MFGIETNLVIKSLPALWLNHSLLFDCPLVKTSILFLSSVLMVQTLDKKFLHSISKPSSVLFQNLLQGIERMSRGLVSTSAIEL